MVCMELQLIFMYVSSLCFRHSFCALSVAIEDKRAALTLTAAIMLIAYLVQAIVSWLVGIYIKVLGPKKTLFIGQAVLPIRAGIFALMSAFWYVYILLYSMYFGSLIIIHHLHKSRFICASIIYRPNVYAMTVVQILDGIGAGIYDTMIPIVVKRLTEGSGHFGFAFGFIITCWRIGHGLSLLLGKCIPIYRYIPICLYVCICIFIGEVIAHSAGYPYAFVTSALIGILSLLLLLFGVHIPPVEKDEEEVEKVVLVLALNSALFPILILRFCPAHIYHIITPATYNILSISIFL